MVPPDENRNLLKRGDVIGGYEVEGLIAEGGMAVVYRARKELLQRTVAIKVLRPCFACDPKFLRRFVREARLAAKLDHPNIVKVIDVGEADGHYYIVMEYLEGQDLRNMVEECGPFSYRKALRLIRQVAEGLTFAHEQGVIHRDIKPANIILTTSGEAKIADFGLARAARPDHEVTTAGQILGTIAYMSPEQCRGDTVDVRTDLYSLGSTLYMLLSGRPPFQGHPSAVMLHQVINTEPPLIQALVPDLPKDVISFIKRLMAKHPGARWQTGREVVDQINRILASRFVFATDARKSSVDSSLPGLPWFAWVRNAILTAALAVCASLLWPHLASLTGRHAEAEPATVERPSTNPAPTGSETTTTTTRKDPLRIKLEDRMESLKADVARRDPGAIHKYFARAIKSRPSLLGGIQRFLESLRSDDLEVKSWGVRGVQDNEGIGYISFVPRAGGRPRMLYIHWIFQEGDWLILECMSQDAIETSGLGGVVLPRQR